MGNLNEDLSEYIKLERFKAKLSQDDMAKRLKVSRNTYNKWENEPAKLSLDTLDKINLALGNNIQNFFNQ